VGIAFALGAALLWGAADFFARLAAERVGTRRTVFFMQLIALGVTGALLAWPAFRPPTPSARMLALAACIGVVNVAGAVMLYRALEIGTVSLVSPVSSTFAAVSATLAIGVGERPSGFQLAGLLVTVAGVIGASIPASGPLSASRRGVGLAAGAALAWGLGFFALRYVVHDLGSVAPVVISRLVAAVIIGMASAARRAPLEPPRGTALLFIVAIAVGDSGAFILYNLGISTALTSIVTVVASLFSAVTVLLAHVFLRERLGRWQWAAVGVILAGVAMVSSRPG